MGRITKGFAAGVAATAPLSALMVIKSMMGLMPTLDLPKMIAGMMGAPDRPVIGWAVHLIFGEVFGGIYGQLSRHDSHPAAAGA